MKIIKSIPSLILIIILTIIYFVCGYIYGYHQGYKNSQIDYINYLNKTLLN